MFSINAIFTLFSKTVDQATIPDSDSDHHCIVTEDCQSMSKGGEVNKGPYYKDSSRGQQGRSSGGDVTRSNALQGVLLMPLLLLSSALLAIFRKEDLHPHTCNL